MTSKITRASNQRAKRDGAASVSPYFERTLSALLATAAGAMYVWMAWGALVRAQWALDTEPDGLIPTAGSGLAATIAITLTVLALAVYAYSRRSTAPHGSTSVTFLVILTLVVVGFVLGFAAYYPCDHENIRGLNALTWTASLFAGGFEASAIGPDATNAECAAPLPLAMQLARGAAIAATFTSVVAAVITVFRGVLSRWSLRFAHSIDVVVGLDEITISLVRGLLREREDQRGPETARDRMRSRWERWRRYRGTKVVVVHPTRNDTLAREAVQAGAVVLVGERNEALFKTLIKPRWHGRIVLRRFYAVSTEQHRNLRMLATVEQILRNARQSTNTRGPREGIPLIPRLIVRLDDPQEAREWRISRVDEAAWFVDALTFDDLLAEAILTRSADDHVTSIMVAGDTPLTARLLEEIGWRARKARNLGPRGARVAANTAVVVGDRAEAILADWHLRHPDGGGIDVSAISGDWETHAASMTRAERSALIVTDASDGHIARASRVARARPDLTVFARDDRVHGISDLRLDTPQIGAVLRFGPILVTDGLVPEDSWTKLARLQHLQWTPTAAEVVARGDKESFWTADPTSRRPWGGISDDDPRAYIAGIDVRRDPMRRLPEFYREDNLRQQRSLLTNVVDVLRREWAPTAEVTEDDALVPDEILLLARLEHERWLSLRLDAGWSGFDEEGRDLGPIEREQRRLNRNVRTWDRGVPIGKHARPGNLTPAERSALIRALRHDNAQGIQTMLASLRSWGIAPRLSWTTYRRTGVVHAERLAANREWRTERGDVLKSVSGDWWVTSPDGTERGVDASRFEALYAPVSDGGYRRVGSVQARRVPTGVSVPLDTREGAAIARGGDWIVRDSVSDTWAVPDQVFRASYEGVTGAPDRHTLVPAQVRSKGTR